MYEQEWNDFRVRYLVTNNIYLPDNPETRVAYHAPVRPPEPRRDEASRTAASEPPMAAAAQAGPPVKPQPERTIAGDKQRAMMDIMLGRKG